MFVQEWQRSINPREQSWESMFLNIEIPANGSLRISLYDNNLSYPYCTTTEAFFDDFRVQRLQAQVFQENHYDPWGLNLKGIEENDLQTQQTTPEFRYQYNGKEKTEDLGLMWNNHGARHLDLQLGYKIASEQSIIDKIKNTNAYESL